MNPATCLTRDESGRHYTKWNKPVPGGKTLHDFIYIKCPDIKFRDNEVWHRPINPCASCLCSQSAGHSVPCLPPSQLKKDKVFELQKFCKHSFCWLHINFSVHAALKLKVLLICIYHGKPLQPNQINYCDTWKRHNSSFLEASSLTWAALLWQAQCHSRRYPRGENDPGEAGAWLQWAQLPWCNESLSTSLVSASWYRLEGGVRLYGSLQQKAGILNIKNILAVLWINENQIY